MKELNLNEYSYHQPILNLSLIVSQKIITEILELAFTEDGCEQGGFLIGKYPDNFTAVIEGIVSPVQKKSDRTNYIRHTEDMQGLWDTLYKDTGLIYLGEWHSHPTISAQYSNIDCRTMIEISESDTVNIRYPIFMIVGLSKEFPDIRFYTIHNKSVYTYE